MDFPDCCSLCGQPSTRRVKVSSTREIGGESIFVKIMLGFFRVPFFSAIAGRGFGQRQAVTIHLPQCKSCSRTEGKISPKYIDFGRGTMTFVVHEIFAKRVRDSLRRTK